MAGVELEDVVRHARRNVLHEPEPTASLLLHLEPHELEHVVAAFLNGRELVAGNGEDGAALDGPVEANHDPASGSLGGDNGRGLLTRHHARPDREALGIFARALDDEGAVEAVRAADTADRNEIGHGFYSLTISS